MSRDVAFKAEASDEDLHLVYGEVYIPDTPDADNEFMDAEGIRKAAHDFMRSPNLGNVDTFHTNELSPGAHVVESFIARKGDPLFKEGSWVVGVHVPDQDTWAKIKKGDINGFSMEAFVSKSVVEVEMEAPCTIPGKTMKAEDGHDHDFYVSYGADGSYQGGVTSINNGHRHVIKRGTVTEVASNHRHKFSHVEAISMREVPKTTP